MTASERRQAILARLTGSSAPISATALAKEYGVSRQIIVGDIALLRAGGRPISATPRGYVMEGADVGLVRTVAVCHTRGEMGDELRICVDNGCTVVDVIVEHPVYGQLTGQLQLSSRYDVDQFLLRAGGDAAQPLSTLTGGIHLHTLRCPNEEAFRRVKAQLDEAGFLLKE